MQTGDFKAIASLPLFSNVDVDRLQTLTDSAFLQRFPAHTILFEQGGPADFLHVLLDGSVELFAHTGEDQRGTTVEVLQPVDTFILAAVLTGTPYLMGARVLKPSRILMLPAEVLQRRIAQDSSLALAMMGSLAQHFRMMVRQVKNLKLRTSVQRVGCYVLELAEAAAPETAFDFPYSKRIIASRLGMTPENFSRALASLRENGVSVRGNTVRIDSIESLRRTFQADALIDQVERGLVVPTYPAMTGPALSPKAAGHGIGDKTT